MLREYGNVLEADVQRFYGIDLCDLWRGRLSLRRLRVLIEYLPREAAIRRHLDGVYGTPLDGWQLPDLLLGRLVDEIGAYRWQWESAHMDEKERRRHRKPPEPVLPDSKAARPGQSGRSGGDGDADVIPLVSPHKLGGFINTDDPAELTANTKG